MTVLYAKYSRTRRKEFQTETLIVSEGDRKYVIKRALTPEARAHVARMHQNHELFQNSLAGTRFRLPRILNTADDAITFEYVDGESYEKEVLLAFLDRNEERFVHVIEEYSSLLKSATKVSSVFKITGSLDDVFDDRQKAVMGREGLFCQISNLDLTFDNIIVQNGAYYVTDTEWVFQDHLPLSFILFRSLHQLYKVKYQEFGIEEFVPFTKLLGMLGLSTDVIDCYMSTEHAFQLYVHGQFATAFIAYRKNIRTLAEIDQLRASVDDQNQRNGTLREELEALVARNHLLQNNIESLARDKAKYHAQIGTLSQTVTERDAQISALSQTVTERDAQIGTLSQTVTERDAQIGALSQTVTERDAQIGALSQSVTERNGQIGALSQTVTERDRVLTEQNQLLSEKERILAENTRQLVQQELIKTERDNALLKIQYLTNDLHVMQLSRSWRLTAPLRKVDEVLRRGFLIKQKKNNRKVNKERTLKNITVQNILRIIKTYDFKQAIPNIRAKGLRPFLRNAWRDLTQEDSVNTFTCPPPTSAGLEPAILKQENSVNAPENERHTLIGTGKDYFKFLFEMINGTDNDYVSISSPEVPKTDIKLIAFYLPQFHPIPENDEWWGKGFTEWTNVTKAIPQFIGHYQPRLPGELGYYDLRIPEVQKRQIQLAKQYGISGFCFHFYWFQGEKVLESPLEQFFTDKTLDFPFCINWANESWSRRWDGRDSDILLEQRHTPEDDIAFITEVSKLFEDVRYIRIDGKPLLIIYRPALFPKLSETSQRWRNYCRNNGIGEIYLALTHSFEHIDPRQVGFDAAIEFAPNTFPLTPINNEIYFTNPSFDGTVYEYANAIEFSKKYPTPPYKKFRGIFPSWDNESRKRGKGTIYYSASPQRYKEWLDYLCEYTRRTFSATERLIFVNAWNEWAEGAYLEPDMKYGYAFLNATAKALIDHHERHHDARKIIFVSHDAHFHGAQLLSLNIIKILKLKFGYDVHLLLKSGGQLEPDFSLYATVYNIDRAFNDATRLDNLINDLYDKGADVAICNTVVSGDLTEILARKGINVITLVHELPETIRHYEIENHADLLSTHSSTVVFPAEFVRDKFKTVVSLDENKTVVLPQGLFSENRYKFEQGEARVALRKMLSLPEDAQIILGVGYAYYRKGIDLFLDVAKKVGDVLPKTYFVWIGKHDPNFENVIDHRVKAYALKDRIIFVDAQRDIALYYAGADIFLMTSREDPFPCVVPEAMDVRLPVIGFSDAGGFKDIVTKDTGVLVPYLDVDAMSAETIRLLSNQDERKRLGYNGSLLVETNLNFKDYVYRLLSLLGHNYMRVSVVVPNYNYGKYLESRLQSIARQTYPVYEVIVLDDASNDNSLDIVQSFAASGQADIKILADKSNSGSVFKQWAKGISLARGEYIWIAEADDLCEPTFLREVLKGFEDREVVFSYSQSKQIDENGKVLCENYLNYTADIDSNKWTKNYVRDGRLEIADTLAIKNTIPNVSSAVFKKTEIDSIVEDLVSFKIAGDWFFYIWLLQHGKISFCAKPLNLHRRHVRSVVAAENKEMHYDEVVKIQEFVISQFPVEVSTKDKIYAYREYIKKYLGITC